MSSRSMFSTEDRVMGVLLVLVPLSFIAGKAGWSPTLQFFLSVGSVIPLAAYIGSATESLADRLGTKTGGLLNATFGNAPDLFVGVFGVQRGLIPLVKATLVGALISNSALIMGLCYVASGLRYGRTHFNRDEAGHHSVLMMLTVAAILFPSVSSLVLCGGTTCHSSTSGTEIVHLSVGIGIALLAAYLAYLAYGIFGLEQLGRTEPEGREPRFLKQRTAVEGKVPWPTWFATAILAGATILLVPVVDILTGSVVPVTHVLGWTQVFVGIIIVANAGNVAEGYAAIKFAWQKQASRQAAATNDSGLDLAMNIASASSVQIATFVAPVVVLYSLSQHTMNLVFSPVEIAVLALLVALFAYIGQDGESNWLEGAQLLVLYAMAAIIFFVLPVSVFAG